MSFDDEEEYCEKCGERVDYCECDDGPTASDILDGLNKGADLAKKIHELRSLSHATDPDAPRKIEEYKKQLREEERHQELLKVEEGKKARELEKEQREHKKWKIMAVAGFAGIGIAIVGLLVSFSS